MPTLLVPGDVAPPIQSQAVQSGQVVDWTLDDALKGAEYLMLVFYPADFTFVCPTEIVQFTEKHAEFKEQKCNVVCCSTDSVYTHLAWLKAPKAERGLGLSNASSIVLLSDRSHEISRAYGVLSSSGAAYRGTFLIDKSKAICQVTINDMPVGRSVDDALRMLNELCKVATDSGARRTLGSREQQANSSNAGSTLHQLSRQPQLSSPQPGRRQQQQQQQDARKQASGAPWTGQQNNQSASYQERDPTVRTASARSTTVGDPGVGGRTGLVTRAAELESQAAQLRLRDSEDRLANVLAEAKRVQAEATKQRADTERLKTEAQQKQSEWDRLLHGCKLQGEALGGHRVP